MSNTAVTKPEPYTALHSFLDYGGQFFAPELGPGNAFDHTLSVQSEKPFLMTHPKVACSVPVKE